MTGTNVAFDYRYVANQPQVELYLFTVRNSVARLYTNKAELDNIGHLMRSSVLLKMWVCIVYLKKVKLNLLNGVLFDKIGLYVEF